MPIPLSILDARGHYAQPALALGLALMVASCQQNPLAVPLPGSQWSLQTTVVDSMIAAPVVRTPGHGTSLTLYAGESEQSGFRRSEILIKFGSVDTTNWEQLLGVELILIQRVFETDLPELGEQFELLTVDEPDTAWSESDTSVVPGDFPVLAQGSNAALLEDTVTVFVGGLATDSVMAHLAFPVDTLILRNWATGEQANNGYLIRSLEADGLSAFHARGNASLSPYLALAFADTTSEGADTVSYQYRRPTADMSIYPGGEGSAPPVPPLPQDDGSLVLNHSLGLRTFLDFSPTFVANTVSAVVGARLILKRRREASRLTAGQVALAVLRRAESAELGDSSVSLSGSFSYVAGADSAVLNLVSLLSAIITGTVENFGLEIGVLPRYNDFDHLTFWGPDADPALRPRLEILYSQPYVEAVVP